MSKRRTRGLQPCEILHVDTVSSQDFFKKLRASPADKKECQGLLLAMFSNCCKQFGGTVSKNWLGDGGHAFFPVTTRAGNSIDAARAFIAGIPILAQQTATILDSGVKADEARRRFRIKAHFGNIYAHDDPYVASAHPHHLDAFLKNEKEFAPIPDELFITD
jgi:hypothetical protein